MHTDEQKFDLMYEQLRDLKDGKSVLKPIYNHVNGTLDTPEEIKPTPIVIIEGLHPFVDERVRNLLDFTIYLDISDEIKFAWKIQRDMKERGHSLESIKASIEVLWDMHCFVHVNWRIEINDERFQLAVGYAGDGQELRREFPLEGANRAPLRVAWNSSVEESHQIRSSPRVHDRLLSNSSVDCLCMASMRARLRPASQTSMVSSHPSGASQTS